MKIRTDLTAFSLTGLCVVAMIVLAGLHQPIPELLATVTLVSLGVGGGAALPRSTGTSSSTPAPAADPDQDVPAAAFLQSSLGPALSPPPASTQLVPGRDWTETIPKITPEMLAAADRDQR